MQIQLHYYIQTTQYPPEHLFENVAGTRKIYQVKIYQYHR